MQGTRERILEFILQHREARVEDLAREFEISTAGIRRHVDNLRADGMVEMRSVKQSTGRPYYVYYPTEHALEQAATSYADLLQRMLVSLGGNTDILGSVMTSVAEAVATRHRSEMTDEQDPELRIVQVTEVLRAEGILDSWHSSHDGFHLKNGVCPYRKVAEVSSLPCEADKKAIELLLGVDVEQIHRIVDGSPMCEYLVRADTRPQILEERGLLANEHTNA